MDEQVEGMIFDIQRYALHDGAGLRTDIFFKGCPLRCAWCANPESQAMQPEFALSAHQCMACGQFPETCSVKWQRERNQPWTQEKEQDYARRVALCPTEAMHRFGERWTAGAVMREVLRDRVFYGDGGGVTLTGGEPTMQPEFAEAILRLARAAGISTAMETCGHAAWNVWERLLPHLDQILFDVKHLDAAVHRQFTGVGNELILSNLRQLIARHAPISIRVPLIPGFNTSTESVRAIALFAREANFTSLDLLPYHTFGKTKYAALNRAYSYEDAPRLTPAELDAISALITSCGLTVNIGG